MLQKLRVWRDVYYASPLDEAAAARLEEDSGWGRTSISFWATTAPSPTTAARGRKPGRLRPAALIGRPLVVILPMCEVSLGGRHIQVPELGQIRYIR